jgi:hypothetical protein
MPEVLAMNPEQRQQIDEPRPTGTQLILMLAGLIALCVVFFAFSIWR